MQSMIPAMERSTRSRVVSVDYWFFVNSSVSAFIVVQTFLLLTHSSSLSPAGGSGGCSCFGGIVNRKQKTTQLVIG
jgi:hypothetical protein